MKAGMLQTTPRFELQHVLLPARVDLVRIFLEGQEGTLDLLMGLGELDDAIAQADVAVLARPPCLPGLLTLTAGDGTRLGTVLVPEGATTGSQDHVGVTQVLEESRQAQRVHATRDDRGGLLHALPLLVVVRAIGRVILQHEGNVLVRGITLHLAKAHGASVDAGRADDTGDLRVHEGGVSSLGLGAGHGAMSRSVVVQELLGEVASSASHRSASCNIAIDQESAVLRQRSELRQAVLAAGDRLVGIIRGDVGREQLAHAGLLDARPHGLDHLRDALVHLAEHLVALGLIVLDEIASLPEGIASLAERLGLQAELGLDNGADNKAAIAGALAQDAPHVLHVHGRAVVKTQERRRHVEVVDLAVLNVAHTSKEQLATQARKQILTQRHLNAQQLSPRPWLLPMARVRKEHIMARPSMMLRSNNKLGYAIFISSLSGSM